MANDRQGRLGGPVEDALLSQPGEARQSVVIDDTTVVLSVEDSLEIGADSSGSSVFAVGKLALYAENVTLNGALDLNNAVISVQSVTTGINGAILLDGAEPDPTPVTNPSKGPGAPGVPGNAGGTLKLGIAVNAGAPPYLSAEGGQGGPGQTGTGPDSGPGTGGGAGDGGAGGAGGTITVMALSPDRQLLTALRTAWNLPPAAPGKPDPRLAALRRLLDGYPAPTPSAELIEVLPTNRRSPGPAAQDRLADLRTLLTAPDDPAIDQLEATVDDLATQIFDATLTEQQDFDASISVAAGLSGMPGTNIPPAPPGGRGQPGTSGTKQLTLCDDPTALLPQTDLYLWAHSSQCRMALEKAKISYFAVDPTQSQDVQDTAIMLRRLQDRTAPFVAIDPHDDKGSFIAAHEQSIGAVGMLAGMQAMHAEATHLLGQIRGGQDVFGYDPDWTPLASFNSYQNTLGALVDTFGDLETAYNAHFTNLVSEKVNNDAVLKARDQANQLISQDSADLPLLRGMLTQLASQIAGYATVIVQKKTLALAKIADAERELSTAFDFDFKDFFSTLASCAMAADSSANWMAQGAQALYGANTTITAPTGEKIDKNYLVDQFHQVEATAAGLIEGYRLLDNGLMEPDDPGAAKLVAVESELTALLRTTSATLGSKAATVQASFDDYVQTVLDRNDQILSYNVTARALVKALDEIAVAKAQLITLNVAAITALPGGLPELTAYVSKLYYRARSQLLQMLDLTGRSFKFWALSDDDLLQTALGGMAPPKIDFSVLKAAQGNILASYEKAIETYGQNPQVFPAEGASRGITVPLSVAQVVRLKSSGDIMIHLPVVTPDTTRDQSNFSGFGNIRLTCVRIWLPGVKTSNEEVQVQITHTGKEQIADQNGTVRSYRHAPRSVQFRYGYSPKINIKIDGEIGERYGSDDTHLYALVGPFTIWRVQVLQRDNIGLELNGIDETPGAVYMEFQGQAYSM